ncbi:Fps1p Ecym_8414 [Eremothecium cymbalariae DBVPG|uniref:Uncharacterized protein n=1 Tax=Eremothecium cymbalariae (strain CBS 270.75 / DBVPG 7215 / KCTC 17166 / NRRL Y-17582) TaxID=931890 RepID=G8JXV9_ERECY|nr:Hypothetical protein Ecym_8414 [Eremothecium cymbalariae DBVPG\
MGENIGISYQETGKGRDLGNHGESGEVAFGRDLSLHPDMERQGSGGGRESAGVAGYVASESGGVPFPMQEVVPSTSAIAANIRNRSLKASKGQKMDGARRSGSTFSEYIGDGMRHDEEEEDQTSIPMMVKSKALYQNPQTPTVLPSNYQPINQWSQFKDRYLKEFFAEFLGTLVLVFFGDAVVAQVRTSSQSRTRLFLSKLDEGSLSADTISYLQYLVTPDVAGSGVSVSLCWAAGVVLGFYASGGSAISGGHLNPVVTLANYFFRGLPARKVPIYWAGQMLGGYFGGLLTFWYYHSVILENFPDWRTNEAVIGCFSVVPLPYLTPSRQFISELVIGALLILGIFSLTDPYTCLSPDLFPVMLFLLIFALLAAGSYQTGAALNPARDIGPRLAMWTVGFDRSLLWSKHQHFFWVILTAPFIGGCLGALIYDVLIFQGHESPVNQPVAVWMAKLRRKISPRGSKMSNDGSYGTNADLSISEKEIQISDIQSNRKVSHRDVAFKSASNNAMTVGSQKQ